MQDQIELWRYVEVGELQRAGEGKNKGDVIVQGEWGYGSVGVGDGARCRGRKGWDAAC